ncbi:MAG: hypothetical protein AAF944_19170 [Bacteroidota bacterium]
MQITKELLQKYASGHCTEAERQRVERWLFQDEEVSGEFDEEKIATELDRRWQAIAAKMDPSHPTKVIPKYKKLTRYAAAACIVIGIFAAGFSTGFTFAKPAADTVKKVEHLTDLLHIYGGDGTYAQITGTRYQIKFEGTLKLYNNANQPKQIVCGEQEFTLEPHRTYHLGGSDDQANLSSKSQPLGAYHEEEGLVGDFSIRRLDN